jgi:hypothetical protein
MLLCGNIVAPCMCLGIRDHSARVQGCLKGVGLITVLVSANQMVPVAGQGEVPASGAGAVMLSVAVVPSWRGPPGRYDRTRRP